MATTKSNSSGPSGDGKISNLAGTRHQSPKLGFWICSILNKGLETGLLNQRFRVSRLYCRKKPGFWAGARSTAISIWVRHTLQGEQPFAPTTAVVDSFKNGCKLVFSEDSLTRQNFLNETRGHWPC